MANREDSSAAEHETYPGPGPLKTDEAKRSIRPVEQIMDAAIERIARETEARAARSSAAATVVAPGHALTLGRSDAAAIMAMSDASEQPVPGGQLALATEKRGGKGRLRWKGLDVSDEFRGYAERVARGEDLPPFTGKILAEPDPAFPWDPSAQKRAARKALKQQIGLWTGVVAFLGLSVAVLIVQVRKQTDAWQAPQSPLATVTMTNQPNQPSMMASASTALESAASENAPAAFSETALAEPSAAVSGSMDTLDPQTSSALAAAPGAPSPGAPSPAAPSPGAAPASAVAAARPAPKAPAATGSTGVFVATRAAVAPTASTQAAAAPPASVTAGGLAPSVGASGAAVAADPAVKAIGTGGAPAGSSGIAAADVAGAADSASALRADPKKEPTREASGMGSLLVESPSF